MTIERVLSYISSHFFKFGIAAYFLGHLPSTYDPIDGGYFSSISWKLTSFHMNYVDFGFIKRGVVGTAFRPLFDVLDDGGYGEILSVIAFDFVSFLAIIYVFSRACDIILRDSGSLITYLKSVAVLSPLGITQVAYDVGRFDHLNYLILVLCIILIAKQKLILAGFAAAFGILVHEAFFIYGVPIMIAYAVSKREEPWRFYVLLFTVLYCAVIVLFYGNASVAPDSILSEDVTFGMEVWSRGLFIRKLPLSAIHYVIIIPYIFSSYLLLYIIYTNNNLKFDWIFASTFFPFALFVVGEDYFRWSHIVMMVVIAAIFIKSTEGPLRFSSPKLRLRDAPLLLLILPLGPIGVDMGFPVASKIIEVLGGSPW